MGGRSEEYVPRVGEKVLVLTGRHFGRVCTIKVVCESKKLFWAKGKDGAMLLLLGGEFLPHEVAKQTIEEATGRGGFLSWFDLGFEPCGAETVPAFDCIPVRRCELPNHGGVHAQIVSGEVVIWRSAGVHWRVHKTREVVGVCWDCGFEKGRRERCATCRGSGGVQRAHAVNWRSDKGENEERVGV